MHETLFIERLPLRSKSDRDGGVIYDPVIQLVVTHGNVTQWNPKFNKIAYDWAFDTCFTGELITSADFLKRQYNLIAGKIADRVPFGEIDKYLQPNGERRYIAQGFGKVEKVPIYTANAWIVSNLPHFRDLPMRIPLGEGIAAQPNRDRHLIGRDLFLGSGVRIEIDYNAKNPSLSMWVPHNLLSIK